MKKEMEAIKMLKRIFTSHFVYVSVTMYMLECMQIAAGILGNTYCKSNNFKKL
jgi:hypothetical protein